MGAARQREAELSTAAALHNHLTNRHDLDSMLSWRSIPPTHESAVLAQLSMRRSDSRDLALAAMRHRGEARMEARMEQMETKVMKMSVSSLLQQQAASPSVYPTRADNERMAAAHRQLHALRYVDRQAVEQAAVERACAKVTLEVLEHNRPARSLYESLGFTPAVYRPENGLALFYAKSLSGG